MKKLINYLLITFLISSIIGCDYKPKFEKIAPIDHPYKFNHEISTFLESSSEFWRYQKSAWDFSYKGEYKKMLETFDTEKNDIQSFDKSEFDFFSQNYKRVDAIKYILEKSNSHQVTIINEAHQHPSHRIFTTELLEELYSQGYRYLGLETLNSYDQELNNRKYPIYKSGTYTKEPQFGNLVREALKIGYSLFNYEATGQSGKLREIGQAKNIQNQISKDPKSKYLIHCGFAHAAEGKLGGNWEKAMAGRLFEYTGINPLTINQSDFNERSQIQYEYSIYQKLELRKPTVFIDNNDKSYLHSMGSKWFDIVVFHPRTNYINGRPNWVFKNDKEKVKLDISVIEIKKPFLIMAFHQSEDFNEAVPVDVIEGKEEDESITLALSTGEYNLIIQNSNNEAMLGKLKVK